MAAKTKRQQYLKTLLSTMRYKDGWVIEFIEPTEDEKRFGSGGFIQITTSFAKDRNLFPNAIAPRAKSRRVVPIYSEDGPAETLNAVWEQILAMEIHEAQEWFEFRGERIFYPHKLPTPRA